MSDVISTLHTLKFEEKATTGNTNLHSYDTLLGDYESIHQFFYPEVSQENIRKLHIFFDLTPKAKEILNVLINDMTTGNNMDNINHINTDDLLKDIYTLSSIHYSNWAEYLPQSFIFSEQLEEMASGMCPQGRVIRLYQVLNALKSQSS